MRLFCRDRRFNRSYENFLKNISGINLFDVCVLEWRKQKKINITKIYKINLQKFVEKLKSKWKYKEEETVAFVRKIRLNKISDKKEPKDCNVCIEDLSQNIVESNENQNEEVLETKEIPQEVVYQEVEIELPEDIETLKKIALMKKQNPNQKEFEIDWKIYLV